MISMGISDVLRVRNRVLVGTFSVSFFTGTLWTSTTPCSCSSFLISVSVMTASSWQQMMPCDEFSTLWIEMCIGLSTNRVVLRRPIACYFLAHSTRKDPYLNLLDSKGRQFTQWEVVSRQLHYQKPWPLITSVTETFVIRVCGRILVTVP